MKDKKELWLEYGFVNIDGFHDVCWYNEGRWQELYYFIKRYFQLFKKDNMYFLWRYGGKNHFLRGGVKNERN